MNRLIADTVRWTLIGFLSFKVMAQNPAAKPALTLLQAVLAAWNDIELRQIGIAEVFPEDNYSFKLIQAQSSFGDHWIGTWATAPQPFLPGSLQNFRNQSLRLIVHTSAGGRKVR